MYDQPIKVSCVTVEDAAAIPYWRVAAAGEAERAAGVAVRNARGSDEAILRQNRPHLPA